METVFSCRCVCKTFLKIVTDPYFAKLHLTKAPNVDHSLIVQHSSLSGTSLAYISDLQNSSSYEITSDPWRNLNILPPTALKSERSFYVLLGSCNGLLYLLYRQDCRSIYYVCNPILGEFMLLPNHGDGAYFQGAIGFCLKTELYKVIRFHQTNRCEIHTLGTNTWRVIENAPSPYNLGAFDSSFNGNLHWIPSTHNIPNLTCSLNLETEKIHYISLPPYIRDTLKAVTGFGVGVLDGLFCIYYLFSQAQLEVSVMKEYGVESSWTIKLTINFVDFLQPPIYVSPMALLNNGDVLFYHNVECLGYYSFRKGSVKVLLKRRPFQLILHAPSFILLKDIAGNKDVEVIRRNPLVNPSCVSSLWSDEEVLRLKQAVSRNRYNTMTYPRIAWGPVARLRHGSSMQI